MKPGDPVIVEDSLTARHGTLIEENVWEGDEQWTYVQLEDGQKISTEPWTVRPDPMGGGEDVDRIGQAMGRDGLG